MKNNIKNNNISCAEKVFMICYDIDLMYFFEDKNLYGNHVKNTSVLLIIQSFHEINNMVDFFIGKL
ncbi:hypothetical protein CHRYSEOSP005_12350 [Chryseobacterium sp. Alg-005]